MDERQLFLVPAPVISSQSNNGQSVASSASSYFGDPVSTSSFKQTNNNRGNMVNGLGQAVMDNIAKPLASAAAERIVSEGSRIIRDTATGGQGPSDGGGKSRHRHSSGYSISAHPVPAPVYLDTGVKPNTYSSDFMEAEENVCSPLHISTGLVQIPEVATETLYNYFMQVVAFDLQTKAQSNVGFNMLVSTDFSSTNILKSINAVTKALQVYFFYSSIISYRYLPNNKNAGMLKLRRAITPQMLEDLNILGRRLADTPIPPNLYQFIRYLSATYSSGMNEGSPLLKICPHIITETIVSSTAISGSITDLMTPSYNTVYTLMRRSVPAWAPKILYDVPGEVLYDENFLTIFANLPFTYYNTSMLRAPVITTLSDNIQYNSFTSALDGVAYSMMSAWNSTSSSWTPGLITPPSGALTVAESNSRRSYYDTAVFGKSFYVPTDHAFLNKQRQQTYYNDTVTTIAHTHLFGAIKCLNVNANSIRQTCESSIDYLMSATTIATAGPKSQGLGGKLSSNRKSKKSKFGK